MYSINLSNLFLNRFIILLSTAFCAMKTYEITFQDTHQKMSPSFALDLAIAFFFFDIMALPSAVYYWGIAEKNVVVVIQHPKINNVPA